MGKLYNLKYMAIEMRTVDLNTRTIENFDYVVNVDVDDWPTFGQNIANAVIFYDEELVKKILALCNKIQSMRLSIHVIDAEEIIRDQININRMKNLT